MFEIKYHPDSLEYGAFTKVDAHCFPDEPIGADKFAEMVTQDFWAVFDSDEFVGFGHVVLKPAFAWIVRLGVSSGCRRQGIGKRLMETMLEHCRKHGRSHVILYVMQDNPAAVGLYHRFGFLECETTYQYVVPIRQFLESRPHAASAPTAYAGPVTAVPIDQVAPGSLPEFPEQWGDIESMQSPPDNYVLIFRTDEGNTVGFCRLSPGFPGCFPFAVDGSFVSRLPEILASLRQYLDPEKEILKLTFPDQALARECDGLGFRLNYRLFKMEKVS